LSVKVRQRDVKDPIGVFTLVDFVAKLDAEAMPTSKPLCKFEDFQGRSPMVEAPAVAAAPAASTNATPNGKAPAEKPAKVEASRSLPQQTSSLQMRKQKSKGFAELQVDDDVETFLEHHPYVKGFKPTKSDLELYNQLSATAFPETPNLRRWYEHIDSFTPNQRESWPAE